MLQSFVCFFAGAPKSFDEGGDGGAVTNMKEHPAKGQATSSATHANGARVEHERSEVDLGLVDALAVLTIERCWVSDKDMRHCRSLGARDKL